MNLRSLGISIVLSIMGLAATTMAMCPRQESGTAQKVLPTIVQIGLSEGTESIHTVGSGVIVTSDGYILTAKHVVSRSQHVYVKTVDGKAHRALYYIADAHRDLALVKIDGIGLQAIELGDSQNLIVGADVYTFGFPASDIINRMSDEATVAKGIISALKRSLPEGEHKADKDDATDGSTKWQVFFGLDLASLLGEPVYTENLIQVDAMMNPGSSGGALTDVDGRLIGICHSLVSNSGSSAGIHFAIELSEAREILHVVGVRLPGGEDGRVSPDTTP